MSNTVAIKLPPHHNKAEKKWYFDTTTGEFYPIEAWLDDEHIVYRADSYAERMARSAKSERDCKEKLHDESHLWLFVTIFCGFPLTFAAADFLHKLNLETWQIWTVYFVALGGCIAYAVWPEEKWPDLAETAGPKPLPINKPLEKEQAYGNSGPAQSSQLNQRFGGTSAAQSRNRHFRD